MHDLQRAFHTPSNFDTYQSLPGSAIPLSINQHLTLNMAANYHITCVNSTDKGNHFGVYQTYPNSPGLKSVAWKVRGVPPKGQIPSTADIDWTLKYGVSIAKWEPNGKTYTGQQIANAELGKAYQVVMTEGDIPTIVQIPDKGTEAGLIQFKNNTNEPLDMGFTMDGSLISVQNVDGGATINFEVHPVYYVACYRNIREGQLVDSDIEIGPVEVKYEDGYTKCSVEAAVQAGKQILKDPVFAA